MQHLNPGATLQNGKYRIERVLGQGGFGITYLATQVEEDKAVAVKEFFLKEFFERDDTTSRVSCSNPNTRELADTFRRKFLKEAQILKNLHHTNLVEIYDSFEENGTAYYAMEYVEGISLAEKLKTSGTLSEKKALNIAIRIASALEYIHSHEINHLDVKPANILQRNSDGKVYLIDFGTSKHYDAQTGSATTMTNAAYSPGYAPLEQYKQGGVGMFTPESDVYSLGATLYKLVTGNTPPEPTELLNGQELDMPQSISYATRAAIKKAMSVAKAMRYPTMAAFREQLEAAKECRKEKNGVVHKAPSKNEETRLINKDSETTIVSQSSNVSLNKTQIQWRKKELEKRKLQREEAKAAKAELETRKNAQTERKSYKKEEYKNKEDFGDIVMAALIAGFLGSLLGFMITVLVIAIFGVGLGITPIILCGGLAVLWVILSHIFGFDSYIG